MVNIKMLFFILFLLSPLVETNLTVHESPYHLQNINEHHQRTEIYMSENLVEGEKFTLCLKTEFSHFVPAWLSHSEHCQVLILQFELYQPEPAAAAFGFAVLADRFQCRKKKTI